MGRDAGSNVNMPSDNEPKLAKVFKTKPKYLSEKKAEKEQVTKVIEELQIHQPMQFVYINLTKNQIKQLQPLFDHARDGVDKDSLGSILCQAWELKEGTTSKPTLQCVFLGHEKAKKISDVIRDL